jgi:hypothetical protein
MLATSLLIVACHKSDPPSTSEEPATVDVAKLQNEIAPVFSSQGVTLTSVTCPAGIPASQTTPFTCTGTALGDQVVVKVTPDGKGGFDVKPVGLLAESKVTDLVEPALKAKSGLDVDIQCPNKVIHVKDGDTFSCPALVAGKPENVDCTVTRAETANVNCNVRGLMSEKTASEGVEDSFKKRGNGFDIQCPPTVYIVAHAGVTFTCPAKLNGKDAKAHCSMTSETDVHCDVK